MAVENAPKPPFDTPMQEPPGHTRDMDPRPDHGESTYRGSGRLAGKAAIITGADSGIGRAVALAYAREGADVLIGYLEEDEDAAETRRLVEAEGRKAVMGKGDVADPEFCRGLVDRAVESFGKLDILVNNAAHQMSFDAPEEISDAEWERTFQVNIHAMFYLVKAALPHLKAGAAIINTTSINADKPNPKLLAYAATKGAIQNYTIGLAQLLGERKIRVNCVAPGPIWTPLIPSTMPAEKVESFGKTSPAGRPGQPGELAPVYVMLASDEASYVSGATVPVTGGMPFI
ncbi:MAG: glucose 1-dehydrogenase [Pseudomonadota bacterium]